MRLIDDRQDPGPADPQATNPLQRPPVSVIAGVVLAIAALAWIAALTPSHNPSLTVEFGQSWSSLLISVALVVGTLLGARILWVLTMIPMVVAAVLVIG